MPFFSHEAPIIDIYITAILFSCREKGNSISVLAQLSLKIAHCFGCADFSLEYTPNV
jgi:hypothetical protein